MDIRKRKRGATVAEVAASILILIPLLIALMFVGIEASQAYLIHSALSQAAQQAARQLAVEYGKDTAITTDRSLQNTLVFDGIRTNGIINASEQFESPVFDTSADPPIVTVTVRYTGNQYGLAPFPNPDPLNIGSNFQLSGTTTYTLE